MILSEVVDHVSRGEKVEYFDESTNSWEDFDLDLWGLSAARSLTFRPKPKPLELWINVWDNGYTLSYRTKEKAERQKNNRVVRVAVHLREVIE